MEVLRKHSSCGSTRRKTHLYRQIVYCCWLAFELVFVTLFIVETKNLSLEETAALFDGEDAKNAISAVGNEIRHDDGDEKGSGSGSYTPSSADLKA